MTPVVLDVATPVGPGRLTLHHPATGTRSVGLLVLGHGAGGSRWTNDVVAVAGAAVALGWVVALADQPWRVAGKKVAARPAILDQAWPALVSAAQAKARPGTGPEQAAFPLIVGGRSAGARVACRTCVQVGADAVLALSFPLHPPGKPALSRAEELRVPALAGLPLLVLQGRGDPFGGPEAVAAELPDPRSVVAVAGTHSLRDPSAVAQVAGEWVSAQG